MSERAECPHCGKKVYQRKDGTYEAHGIYTADPDHPDPSWRRRLFVGGCPMGVEPSRPTYSEWDYFHAPSGLR